RACDNSSWMGLAFPDRLPFDDWMNRPLARPAIQGHHTSASCGHDQPGGSVADDSIPGPRPQPTLELQTRLGLWRPQLGCVPVPARVGGLPLMQTVTGRK